MFCKNCGTQLQEGVAFCHKCGTKFDTVMNNNVGYQPVGSSMVKTIAKRKINIIRIIASVILSLSVFLPYVTSFGKSKALIQGDGTIFIALVIATIICDIARKNILALVLSIVTLVITIYEVIHTMNIMSDYSYGLIKYGLGFYLLIIGAIGMVIAAPLMKVLNKK